MTKPIAMLLLIGFLFSVPLYSSEGSDVVHDARLAKLEQKKPASPPAFTLQTEVVGARYEDSGPHQPIISLEVKYLRYGPTVVDILEWRGVGYSPDRDSNVALVCEGGSARCMEDSGGSISDFSNRAIFEWQSGYATAQDLAGEDAQLKASVTGEPREAHERVHEPHSHDDSDYDMRGSTGTSVAVDAARDQ